MFVQVVTYSLEGISEEGYLDVANGVAPRYAGLPGLLAKIWLENPGGNRYGAVYFWEDVESMERFGNSDLFEGDTEEFTDFFAEEFKVLENLTLQTQPVLEIVEGRGGKKAAATAAPGAATTTPAPTSPTGRSTAKRTPPPPKPAKAGKGAAKTAKAPAKTAKAPGTVGAAAKTAQAPAAKAPAKASKVPAKGAAAKKAGKKAVR